MPTCPQCGNAEPDEAQWCGRCYLPFAPTPSSQGFGGVVMPGEGRAAAPPAAAPPPAPVAPPPAAVVPLPAPAQVAAPQMAPVAMAPIPPAAYAPPMATTYAPPIDPPPAWGTAAPLERTGWQPPATAAWSPPGPAPDAAAEGRLFSGRAIAMVAISIGLGVIMQAIAYLLSRDTTRNVDSQIRWSIVLTVVQYAVVAGIVLSQITPKIRLRWGPGSPIARAAIGALVGLGGGGLILLLLHAATGTLSSDKRVVLLMSGGEATRIIAAVLLTCLAAPLVEEVLFRGLLLESLRHYSAGMALFVSAMFFAVWHLNRQALIYYTVMGLIFGGLYMKRGLVASMTAHFCFNGALTIAAIVIVIGPSHTYDVDGLRVTVPAGWTDESAQALGAFGDESSAVLLQGPDASVIAVTAFQGPGLVGGDNFDAHAFAQRLSASNLPLPGGTYDPASVRELTLPTVGPAVEVAFSLNDYQAYKGRYVFFSANREVFMAMLVNGGSAKANSDFTNILNTLQLSPAAVTPS